LNLNKKIKVRYLIVGFHSPYFQLNLIIMKKLNLSLKGYGLLAILSGFTLFGCSKEVSVKTITGQENVVSSNQQMVAGQYIITLKDAAQGNLPSAMVADKIRELLSSHKLGALPQTEAFINLESGFAARLSDKQVDQMRNDPRVAAIEQDQQVMITATTTGTTTIAQPKQIAQWGVKKTGYGSGVGKTAWIIDTGVDSGHPDLTVDKTRSKSFLTSSSGGNWSLPWDENGHGTHVSGIIAAKDNGIGVVGVAAGATIVSVRVLDKSGAGYVSTLISGINYVAANGKKGDVVNISIGASPSTALDNAVIALANKDIYVAIAAGNNAADAKNYSPARVSNANVYTVSAMDSFGSFASFSNYGATTIKYTAPGKNIISTYMGSVYKNMSGTSMASPHMAGILLMTGGLPKYTAKVKSDPDVYTDMVAQK
jgi:subtilisin family serine protease